MTIQDVKTAQTTLHEAIDQAYQKGAFSLSDSVQITNALTLMANFIGAIEQQQAESDENTITEQELIEALEKSPDNPANKK
jgi:hypothetical protein